MKRWRMGFAAITLTTMMSVGAHANDEQIAKTIVERLQQQRQAAQLEGFNLGVQVENGTVTVMGSVAEAEHAMLALDVARRVPGVKLVVNDLNIQSASSTPATATVNASTADALVTAPLPPASTQLPAAPTQVSHTIPASASIPAVQTQVAATAAPKQPAAVQRPLAFAPGTIGRARQVSHQTAADYGQAGQQAYPSQQAQYACSTNTYSDGYGGSGYVEGGYSSGGYSTGTVGAPTPVPMMSAGGSGMVTAAYDNPQMPGYAWPSYAAYPNYAAVTYPHQYSPTAWPYIGPFYPYPQVPLGWRKVALEWDDGWWFLDFKSK